MSATNILISIGAQTASAVSSLDKVNSALGRQMSAVDKTKFAMQKLAVPAAAAFAAIGAAAISSVKAAEEAAAANAKLSQVFESMGYAENAKAAQDYADALEGQIGVEAEVIKAAQTKLATFSDVAASAGLMARATRAAADLSAAGFGEMSSVSNGLGKALQDPIKGMGLLTKAGSLTKAEQEKIAAAFKATGDKAAAQNSILAALETQVGGVAAASATTSEKMTLAFDSISEAVGTALLPAFEMLMPLIQKFADWASAHPGVLLAIGGIIAGLAGTVLLANGAMAAWTAITLAGNMAVSIAIGVYSAFAAVVAFITSPIGLVVAAVALLIAGIVLLWKNWDTVSAALVTAWNWLKATAISVFSAIRDWLAGLWGTVKAKVEEVWNSIKSWLSTTWNSIKSTAISAFDGLKTKLSEIWTTIKTTISDKVGDVVDLMKGLPGKVLSAVGNLGSLLYDKGRDLIQGFINGIKSLAGAAASAVADLVVPGRSAPRSLASVPGRSLSRAAVSQSGVSTSRGSATFNFYGASSSEDARVIKRVLEGYDVSQGRRAGQPLRVAW